MLVVMSVNSVAMAQKVSRSFSNTPMPLALKSIAEASDSLTINFMYDELEDFVVTTTINAKPIRDAIRQVVGFYPIKIVEDRGNGTITLECTNKAQRRIKGMVKSNAGTPLEYANVLCLSPSDSTFLAGGVSNESGVFVIPCKSEDVLLRVSFVGYATQYVRCTKNDAGVIIMHEAIQDLMPVTISSRRLQIDSDGYAIDLNVGNMQASDILSYLPSFSIRNSSYCINGKEVEAIYVDGYAIASTNELCNLPSEMVSQIKVDYKSNTIHLSLRNPEQDSSYGAINGGISMHKQNGLYDRYAGGIWYARHKGLTVYDKLDYDFYNLAESVKQSSRERESVSVMAGTIMPERTQVSNRLSLTQELNPRHTIGASYYVASNRMNASSEMNGGTSKYPIYYDGKNQYVDHEGTVRYTALWGKQNISVNFVADLYSRETSSENLSLYGAGVGTETGESPSIRLWKHSGDMMVPLPKAFALRLGYDIRYFTSHYDPSKFVSNFKGSPALTYKMQLYGFSPSCFGEMDANWKKMQLSVGFKWQMNNVSQNADSTGMAAAGDGDYTQRLGDVHANAEYKLGKVNQHRLYASYQHHLDELPYAVMSPFIRWSDAYNYSLGNPTLRAPSTKVAEAGISLWNNTLNVNASYQSCDNEIFWQTSLSKGQTDVFYTQPINLSDTHQYRLYAEQNLHPLRFWHLKMSERIVIRPESETIAGCSYSKTRMQQSYNLSNRFQFCNGWVASVSATYVPTYHMYNRTYHSIYNMSGDVSRTFLDNRLQCKLSFTAFGNKRHLDRQVGDMHVCYKYTMSEQSVGIHLAWRLTHGKSMNKTSIVSGEQTYQDIKDK